MKKMLLCVGLLFSFCFLGIGQVDTVAVRREVDSLIQVSRTLTKKKDFDKALEVIGVVEKLVLENLGRETPEYAKACYNHGRIFHNKGSNFNEAELWYLEAKSIRERILGKLHPDYTQTLVNLSGLYFSNSQYEKAEPVEKEVVDIRASTIGKESPEYAGSVSNLANLYVHMGQYEKAEPLFFEAKFILEKTLGDEHPDYAGCINNLAILYWKTARFEKAEKLNLIALKIDEKTFGKEHPFYASDLNNLGILYRNMGYYDKSEDFLLQATSIQENISGKNSPEYAKYLNNLASIYWDTGNFEKAEVYYLEAIAIREKLFGKENLDYAFSLESLAILFSSTKRKDKAEALYLESKAITEKSLGKEHPDYAQTLANLAGHYSDIGENIKAQAYYLEAKNIIEKASGKNHLKYALILINTASLYQNMGLYERADSLYLESKAILENTIGSNHTWYVRSLRYLVDLYWSSGNTNAAMEYLLQIGETGRSILNQAAKYQSAAELSLNTNQYISNLDLIYSFDQMEHKIDAACYENSLFYKGFLLSATSQLNNLALSDSLTTESYSLLKSYHRRLAIEYAKPTEERKNVAELEEKANTLEKELTRTVAGFGEALRQVTWQEVQSALKPNEAAIEFIRFNYYTPEPTDSVLYAALLLTPGMESPSFISLFEEKQLQAILAPLAGQGSDGLNELYAGQAGHSLSQLLWKPLEPSLRGTKAIYISPAGLLHRLNLSAIPTTQTSTETIGKRFDIYVVGSTRQLVVGNTSPTPSSTADAIVFGGIQYEMDSSAIAPAPLEESYHRNRGLSFNHTDSTLRGDTWRYLKYSEKEVVNIQSQLQKAGYQTAVHKGFAATEEAFKQIGKDRPAPKIIHLSTHGFFFPDVKNQLKALRFGSEEPVFKISDNPMIRAGLILAGGNYAWKTGKPLGSREDGILTAYEISQMDLRNTDLVVLSACETGLGQIEGNEGVYGLQRAFKIAGAKHLVMSLWQIPDFHTQELMTAFYNNMLTKKMTVREALIAAQETMRLKRYEPFYWAGFVLVE